MWRGRRGGGGEGLGRRCSVSIWNAAKSPAKCTIMLGILGVGHHSSKRRASVFEERMQVCIKYTERKKGRKKERKRLNYCMNIFLIRTDDQHKFVCVELIV